MNVKIQNKALQYLIRLVKSLIIPVGIWGIFALLTGGRTASTRMLLTTLRQSVSACIICYGLIMSMNVGMINFSAGGMMLFAGIVGGNIAKNFGLGWPGLVVVCILICLAEGALEGLLYNAMRVPCIVMSIGMMLVWESLPKVIYPSGVNLAGDITILCKQPYCFWVLGITAVIFYIVFNKTAFGHNLRAIGSNQAIANSVGLDSDKIKFAVFTISGLFLGIGAVLYVSLSGEVRNVSAMGSMTIMMDGFMGMFIAMFISRYIDTSIAVVLGTFAMKMMSNGFVAMGISATVRDIIQGFFLLILLVISANAGLFERLKADKAFKQKCIDDYQAAHPAA